MAFVGQKQNQKKLIRRCVAALRLFGRELFWGMAAFLLSAMVLLMGLKLLFPEGRPAKLWIESGISLRPVSLTSKSETFEFGSDQSNRQGRRPAIATLTFVRGEVKNKRADSIIWANANLGLALFDRDAVQTLSASQAVITFDANNYLELDENALVIIRLQKRKRLFRAQRSFMVVLNGSLRGKIRGGDQAPIQLAIAVPNGVAQIDASGGDTQSIEFEVDVRSDQSTQVKILKGSARVTANGQTVTLKENEATKIEARSVPVMPKRILPSLGLKSPEDKGYYYYRRVPPEVLFAWQSDPLAMQYRFQLSKSRSFAKTVLDEHLSLPDFLYGNLKSGLYFWRIAALDQQGLQGKWSEIRKIEVFQILSAPNLDLFYPVKDEIINQTTLRVRGASVPNVQIYVNGETLESDDKGRFEQEVPLKKGINLILVEAIDQVGNVSIQRRLISRKF